MRERMIELIKEQCHGTPAEAVRIADNLIRNGAMIPVRCKDCVSYVKDSGMCLIRYKHKGIVRSEKVEPNFFCKDGRYKMDKEKVNRKDDRHGSETGNTN